MNPLLSVRLKSEQYTALKQQAEKEGRSVALLLRDIIEQWHLVKQREQLRTPDKIQIQGLAEALYILRVMADKFEPHLKDAASTHASRYLSMILEKTV